MSRLKWSFKADSMLACSPAVGPDGTCYVGCRDRKLYAVGPDGALRWTLPTGGPIDAAPSVLADGTVVLGGYDGRLRAVDPGGAVRWERDLGAPVMTTPCVDDDGHLWIGADDGALHGFDEAGERLARVSIADLVTTSPVCSGGVVYVCQRTLYGSDGSRAAVAAEPVVAAPAVGADGTLYVGSWDGYVYAVRDGVVQWNAPVQGQVYAGCAVGPAGQVLVGTRAGEVVALSPAGERLWDRKLSDGVYGTPAIAADGTCFLGANDNRLYALDLATGEVVWKERVGRDIRSSVALTDDGTVIAASWDWSLYAYEGGAGGPADSPWPQFHRDAARSGRAPSDSGGETEEPG